MRERWARITVELRLDAKAVARLMEPAFDFGNLLRPPLGDVEAFEEATAKGYRLSGRKLPPNCRCIARIADLFAWAEFLDRPNLDAARIDGARKIIGNTITELDVGDWG